MIFDGAAKAQLLALIGDLDPTPETNPLQAQLDAANETIGSHLGTIAALAQTIEGLEAKISAAQQALA